MAVSNKYLASVMEAYHLQGEGGAVFDIVNGCPVTLSCANYGIALSFPLEQGAFESMKDALNQQLKAAGTGRVVCRQGYATAQIKKPKLLSEQYGAIRQVISSMAAPYVRGAVCPYCKSTGCDAAAVHAGLYRPVHRRCYEANYSREREKIDQGTGSYITGVIGALLGALVMMAIAFLIILWTKTAYGWLFVLMPAASLFGYKTLKGPYGAGGMAVVGVSSALVMLLFLYCEIIRQICETLGVTVADCLSALGEVSSMVFTGWFLGSCWFELAFFAVGLVVIIAARPLSKSKQTGDLDKLRSLTRPLYSTGDPEPQPQAPSPFASWNPEREA